MARYNVKKDDNLLDIAKKFGVTTSAILDANPGVRSIGAGVTLRIPTGITTLGGLDPRVDESKRPPKEEPPLPGTPPPILPPESYPTAPPQTVPPTKKKTPKPAPQVPIPPRFQPPAGTPYVPPTYVPKVGGVQPPVVPPAVQPAPFAPQTIPGYVQPEPFGLMPRQPEINPYGVQPGTLQSRIVGMLNRIFNRRPGVFQEPQPELEPSRPGAPIDYYRQFLRSRIHDPAGWRALGLGLQQTGRQLGRQVGGAIQRAREQAGEPTQELGPTVGRWYEAGRTGAYGETSPEQIAEDARRAAMTSPFTDIYQQRYGIPTATGEVQGYILGDFRDVELPLDPDLQEDIIWQKANRKKRLFDLGEEFYPLFVSKKEQYYLGLTDEQMAEQGYVFDEESGQWILGEAIETPQVYGTAAPYSYGYPSYGYPQYIYPEGGGGGYTYPQSFVGREGGPYPQSFVQPERRGVTPEQARNRAARFGAVTWRI